MKYEGVYVDASGRSLYIRTVEDANEPYRVRVTLPAELDAVLRNHRDYPFEIAGDLRAWVYQDEQAGEMLKVEAGVLRLNHVGPTLNLMPLSSDRLKPKLGIGLYDDWEDDLGLPWALPLSVYRRQAPSSEV